MRRQWIAGAGSATTVVLAGVSGALINELHGGWPWFLAAGGVVLLSAGLTWWLTVRAGNQPGPGAGSVTAGRDIHGPVRTKTTGPAAPGSGSVTAGRDIRGGVTTETNVPPENP